MEGKKLKQFHEDHSQLTFRHNNQEYTGVSPCSKQGTDSSCSPFVACLADKATSVVVCFKCHKFNTGHLTNVSGQLTDLLYSTGRLP